MSSINEIAPDVYRISTYVPEFDLQFNQFLVKDDEPLLYHTGMRAMFPQMLETVRKIVEPSTIRWIGFSHFEADECGALNNWLESGTVCRAGVYVRRSDGQRERLCHSASPYPERRRRAEHRQVPVSSRSHASSTARMGCGNVVRRDPADYVLLRPLSSVRGCRALDRTDLIGRFRETLTQYQAGPLANYMPYHSQHGAIAGGIGRSSNRRRSLRCMARPLSATDTGPYWNWGQYWRRSSGS